MAKVNRPTPKSIGAFDPSNRNHDIDNESPNASDRVQGNFSHAWYVIGAVLSFSVMGGVVLLILYIVARIIWP